MSKKANPTVVGLFVLAGLALAVGGVLLFGSSKMFRETHPYVLYFADSVKGLNPGSAVRMKGVRVGEVKEILLSWNQKEGDLHIPVIIEVDEGMINPRMDEKFDFADQTVLDQLIGRGLRARLDAESLLTGLLYVDISVHPEAPPAELHQREPIYQEIPTMQNNIQMLMANIAKMDFGQLIENLDSVLETLDRQLGAVDVGQISAGLTNVLHGIDQLVDSPGLAEAMADLDDTLSEIEQLAKTTRENVDPVSAEATATLKEARETLAQLRQAGENLETLLAPHSPLTQELTRSVSQLGEASRAIAELADYLSRNPKALLTGRKPRE